MTITEDRERLESRLSVVLKASREVLNVSQRKTRKSYGMDTKCDRQLGDWAARDQDVRLSANLESTRHPA